MKVVLKMKKVIRIEKTLITRKHQTPGKRMGTENDTCLMGSHVTIVAVPEKRST
jgi:hypothetical protein